MEDMAKL
jgi:hypothetical protein